MSDIYLSLTETPAVVTLSQPVIASSVAATVTVGNTVTVALDANSLSALENVTVTVGSSVALAAGSAQIGSVTVANFPSTQTIAGTVTANAAILNSTPDYIKVTVDASDLALGDYYLQRTGERLWESTSQADNVSIYYDGNGWHCTESANNNDIANAPVDRGNIPPLTGWTLGNQGISFAISYENPLKRQIFGTVTVGNSVTIGSLPAISGTVTANNPSGALTTRFGSVTTANTAQITSAVTNTSRKYLLAQNISAGTVTIGIGFFPTTTQGIQLTAGAGLTFDAFCPTGAVYWLGAVTGAAYTILEG